MAIHDITYMTYIAYVTYITYITDSTYSTYMTYRTYMTYITDTLHFLRFQSMTRHDMTLLHILTYGAARMGRGRGQRRKKAELCTFMLPEVTNIYSSPCSPILLCCQPEPSLSRYLPDYHELLHDSLADCKLKGDELST
jgi:hypothetical protein